MMNNFTTLLDNDDQHVSLSKGENSEVAIFTCTGVGHAMGGIDVQKKEFVNTAFRHGTIVTVIDKTRSWGNRVDFQAIADATRDTLKNASMVMCVGNSMGAFNAVVLSHYVRANRCLAFATQYSVLPRIVPNENRWRKYVNAIERFEIESLESWFGRDTHFTMLSGNELLEQHHWSKIPNQPNIANIVVRNADHDIAAHLKYRGLLESIFEHCLKGSSVRDLLRSAEIDAVDVNTDGLPSRFQVDLDNQKARQAKQRD